MVYTRHVHPRLRGRRTVAIVSTVAALVLAFAPATAAAEPPAADGAWLVAAPARVSVTIGPLRYSANPANFNAGARVDRFTGASNGIMSLPPEVTIAGVAYRVTEIGARAFAGTNVTVRLPETLRTIGPGAFANGDRVTVQLPEGLESIGAEAFIDNRLQRLTLPDSVRTVGDRAFAGNPLNVLHLGGGVQRIGAGAFPGSYDLVRLPASVFSLGSGAFSSPRLQLVALEGPPPTRINPASAALAGSAVASFGTAQRVPLISFFPCFAAAAGYPSGYTAPTWQGYPTEVSRFEECGPESRLVAGVATVSPTVVARTGQHTLTGVADGFLPHEDVTLRINDGPPFAPVRADHAGRAVITVPAPANLPLGRSRLTLTGSMRIATGTFTVTDTLARIGGANRYATAEQIAYLTGGASAVIVANGEQAKGGYDALAASYLARQARAPVLLTTRDRLPAETERAVCTTLTRNASATKYIYILGQTDSVSAAVEAKLSTTCRPEVPAVTVVRIGGGNRYETAAKIAGLRFALPDANPDRSVGQLALRAGGAWRPTAILASGESNADALAAGPVAAFAKVPVLLTSARELSQPTADTIRDLGITQVIVLGGPDRIPERILTDLRARGVPAVLRIAGADRFETSAKLAAFAQQTVGMMGRVAGVANGTSGFPDALAAASFLGNAGGVLLLTTQHQAPPRLRAALRGALANTRWMLTFGSYGSVSDTALDGILRR